MKVDGNKTIVIAGFAGIGKTYLGEKYANVIDMESSEYKYDYTNVKESDYEKLKGTQNRILNPNFPNNYVKAIQELKNQYDIICVQVELDITVPAYIKNGIDFILCYPDREAFADYKEKYIQRGNNEHWISKVVEYFNKIFDTFEELPYESWVLKKGETLEDRLIEKGFKLIEKTNFLEHSEGL